MILEELHGSTITDVEFKSHGPIEITGEFDDTEARWKVTCEAARFTYAHNSEERSWFVEVRYRHDRLCNMNERRMLYAMHDAAIRLFRIEDHGVFIESDDGRGIEIYYDDNSRPDGIAIAVKTEGANSPSITVLPRDLDKLGILEEAMKRRPLRLSYCPA